jgi:hypothetical protein
MRLADADLLPYNFTGFADTIHRYLDELQKLWQTKQDEAVERNKEIEEGVFTAVADPRKTSVPPPVLEVPPHLNFAPLQNASDALTHSAERYQKALEKVSTNGELAVSPAELQALNQKLMQSERKLNSPEGLPGVPVPTSHPRTRLVHRLRRRDNPRRPRSHRAVAEVRRMIDGKAQQTPQGEAMLVVSGLVIGRQNRPVYPLHADWYTAQDDRCENRMACRACYKHGHQSQTKGYVPPSVRRIVRSLERFPLLAHNTHIDLLDAGASAEKLHGSI